MANFSHRTQCEDFVKVKFHNYLGYIHRFFKLCNYAQNAVILMHNMKLMQSELFYSIYTTYAYFYLFAVI